MDPRLLRLYERELHYIREMGAEFASEFPKIAGRLGMQGIECADPYVERLLEAFGFLAARIQLQLEAQFPRFTRHLIEIVHPHYLAPTPSMAVVQLTPKLREGRLANGFVVPRDASLRSRLGPQDQTPCEYRLKHPITLWPIQIARVEYTTSLGALGQALATGAEPRAAVRLMLRTPAGQRFDRLAIDRLPLFVAGNDEIAMSLYEQLIASSVGLAARMEGGTQLVRSEAGKACVRALGFGDDEAMLPYGPRSFEGYRLLQEYFAFPSRYMFVELCGLGSIVARCATEELDLYILLEREDPMLARATDGSRLLPFCAPAINLFPREADRIHLSGREHEYHVNADRARPIDYEVHSVTRVVGYGSQADGQHEFLPMYGARDPAIRRNARAYYTVQRSPRLLSSRARAAAPRSTYVGSEVFVSLVDEDHGPHRPELRQLGVSVLCTNRDLPLQMPIARGGSDFSLQSGAPVEALRCIAGPSAPRAPHGESAVAWRAISHLNFNYLALSREQGEEGAERLRELLALYADLGDPAIRKQVEGVQSVEARPVTRPLPGEWPRTYGRGLEVRVGMDERAFRGSGVFLLASVLARVFAKQVAINSFAETKLTTLQRGEIMRWPAWVGQRHVL